MRQLSNAAKMNQEKVCKNIEKAARAGRNSISFLTSDLLNPDGIKSFLQSEGFRVETVNDHIMTVSW